jgi:serine/threonine protein kinase
MSTLAGTLSVGAHRGAGTEPFMAPELFEEDEDSGAPLHGPSKAADVYALGVTAWCVLAGSLTPYPAADAAGRRLHAPTLVLLRGARPDLAALPPGAPPALAALLEWCWEARPEARPRATEVLDALERAEELALAEGLARAPGH